MQFENLTEFLAMGGYGLYVWLAYGGCFLALLGLASLSYLQYKKFFQSYSKRLQHEQRRHIEDSEEVRTKPTITRV